MNIYRTDKIFLWRAQPGFRVKLRYFIQLSFGN